MSQEYQHACQRAELLGLAVPSEDEWRESEESRETNAEDGVDDNAIPKNLDQSEESTKRIGGGLGELNSILSSTQRKINRFKTVCGSLGTLLKIRGKSSQPSTPTHVIKNDNKLPKDGGGSSSRSENSTPLSTKRTNENSEQVMHKKIDINEKMGSHLDKLDSLINKAEGAQYSMEHQTKQMKRIIK